MAGPGKEQAALVRMIADSLSAGEVVIAALPFTHVPKRPKGPAGKVKEGIYQSYRRYRPVVLTNKRMFVFDTARTPTARSVLAEFPKNDVDVVSVTPGSMDSIRVVLELPGLGPVPFHAGRKEHADVAALVDALGGVPS